MSYWDSSALVKLYVQELDSAEFHALAVKASRVASGIWPRGSQRYSMENSCLPATAT
jgi:hypothetical protein